MERQSDLESISVGVLNGSEPITAQQFAGLRHARLTISKTPAQRCVSTINYMLLTGNYGDDVGPFSMRIEGFDRDEVNQALEIMANQGGYHDVKLVRLLSDKVALVSLQP